MQLVPIFLLGVSGIYSLITTIFWFIRLGLNYKSTALHGIAWLFGGAFFSSVQLILMVTALIFSVIVLVTKLYSNKSVSVGMVFVTTVFSITQAIHLTTVFISDMPL